MDDLQRIVEIEAIKQLKYRYFRFLDLKQWDDMRELFVEDATAAYSGGKFAFDGRDKIMEFLTNALGRNSMLTAHHGHHPEIELDGDSSATGVWALWDTVIDTQNHFTIRGAAFYRDEYVKLDGGWRFRSTGYERTYEEMEPYPEEGPTRLISNRFAE
jgi:hypothetical protein